MHSKNTSHSTLAVYIADDVSKVMIYSFLHEKQTIIFVDVSLTIQLHPPLTPTVDIIYARRMRSNRAVLLRYYDVLLN